MNVYILTAGILSLLLGVVHSILGEYLIFRHKRVKGSIVPSIGDSNLKERHLRIIWATWHLASIFGWCLGAILIKIARAGRTEFGDFILECTTYTMFVAALMVLVGTKGKHPGWFVLLSIGVLLNLGT